MHTTMKMSHRRKTGDHVSLALAVMLALGGSGVAFAQSVTGGIYGQAAAGETIHIQSASTGVERTVTPGANGQFTVNALNPGSYSVELLKSGAVIGKAIVVVRAGLMSPAAIGLAAAASASEEKSAETLGAVQVNATDAAEQQKFDINPIDVSTSQLISHYSMSLVNDLPTGRNPQSIALLNSNTTYDSQTTGDIEMNGATSAENRYYINGFDATNNRTNIGSFNIPSEAIGSTNTIDGNFDASWSNTTGGNLASTVRQGDNTFRAGYSMYFTPPTSALLMPIGHNTFNSIGNYYTYNTTADHYAPGATQYEWASGPIIKDKLFVFAEVGQTLPATSTSYGGYSAQTSSNRDDNQLVNLTWNITNNQTFDLLAIHDSGSSYSTSYTLNTPYDPSSIGASTGWSHPETYSRLVIGDYQWDISDNFSMHLMVGSSNQGGSTPSSSNTGVNAPYVSSTNPLTQVTTVIGPTNQYFVYYPGLVTEHGYKVDFDWWVGDNKIKFGAEYYRDFQSVHWQTQPDGNYSYYDQPGTVLPTGATVSSTNGNYVEQYYDDEFANVVDHRKSAYVQDSWQASTNVVLYGGVRWDSNTYTDGLGNPVMTLPIFTPRLGLSWDVDGDSTFKVGANAGRYSVSMPSNFATGIGLVQLQYENFYTYTGRDGNNAPTGLTQIGPTFLMNNGMPATPDQIGSKNIKAPYEYAANFYAQKKFSDGWSGLGVLGFTDLKRLVEDSCEEDAITAYAQSHGYPNYVASNEVHQCYEANPGSYLELVRDFAGTGGLEQLNIPASVIGIKPPVHKYYRLTLDLSHNPTSTAPYFLDLSYTFARSFGNTDGLLDLSHRDGGYIGQTYAFQYPEIQVAGDGNLSDDVRNTFVASGVYYFHKGLNGLHVGSILRVNSGAPISCLGSYPDASSPANYNIGPNTYYCDGVPQSRGSMRLPWMWTLGISVGYDWKIGAQNKLSLDLQIQNVTNHQGINDLNQTYDTGQMISQTQAVPSVNYLAPTLTTPRTTQLILRYRFN
jgi:hypothetical protein